MLECCRWQHRNERGAARQEHSLSRQLPGLATQEALAEREVI